MRGIVIRDIRYALINLITIARNVDGAVKAPNSALGKFNWLMS